MEDFDAFLEQYSREWLYRKDGSPLADLQYDMHLLVWQIVKMLDTYNYKHLEEQIKDFEKYSKKYFSILEKVFDGFCSVLKNKKDIDDSFIYSINTDTEILIKEYDLKIVELEPLEAKTINDATFAYQILLRLINTYIKNNSQSARFLNVADPLVYDFEPSDYFAFLKTFAEDQKFLKF